VRRAYLCGKDSTTGFDFEHRRQWIVDRIKLLCTIFAVDLCAYAVMSNHYHVVIRINVDGAKQWSDKEVARRWMQIFSGPLLIHQHLNDADLTATEQAHVKALLDTWRQRLTDLSWFMRCINEPIARMANGEDHCTGRFWEGRFKSQALLDVRAVLACMAYVDLNPIRAAIARTPEQSHYTSIQERIRNPKNSLLRLFSESSDDELCLPFNFKDYLEFVDWSGREIKFNKPGSIHSGTPPILTRLRMDASPVLDYLSSADRPVFGALGPVSRLREFAKSIGQNFIKGQGLGNQLCPERA
jgi:REP element-mobilizing transposase RayT